MKPNINLNKNSYGKNVRELLQKNQEERHFFDISYTSIEKFQSLSIKRELSEI